MWRLSFPAPRQPVKMTFEMPAGIGYATQFFLKSGANCVCFAMRKILRMEFSRSALIQSTAMCESPLIQG